MKLKTILLGACAIALTNLSSYAAIEITVSGGLDEPLTIDFTSGGTFTATQNLGTNTNAIIVFEDIWDNTLDSVATNSSVSTVTLNGISSSSATGTITLFDLTPNDLLVGFGSGGGFSVSDPIVLSTGTRTTGSSLNLNYTTTGTVSGIAYLINSGIVISDSISYTAIIVPEPSTYAALGGLAVLAFAAWRRRVTK